MTVKQKQCLLYYLGYYVGEVDGKWGQLSKVATRAFKKDFGLADNDICDAETEKALAHAVAYGMTAKNPSASTSGDFWDTIKYFEKSEFRCRCGCGADTMEEKLVRCADDVRQHFGRPMTVTSGRRCSSHNAKVGGVSNSRHLSGKAMDFCVVGKTAAQVVDYVKSLPDIRYTYAIDGSYVHMDIE